jgi:mono/diheme cytochrome c family protein
MRALVAVGAIAAVGAAAVIGWFAVSDSARRAQVMLGSRIYSDGCASCHGAKLEGQPNWQTPLPSGRLPAPPHDATGHTWHHSDDDLFTITRSGMAALVPGYASDMPIFATLLADDEIRAALAFIKDSWPERERAYQDARSRVSR